MSNYSLLSQILLPFWVQTKFEEKSLLFSSMSNPKRYMADITLYCYFLGTPINSAIPVDIGEMTCVEGVDVPIEKFSFGHLKKQILPNNNEANKLKLWKFETPFKKDNEKLKLLNKNFHNDTDLEQELGEDLSPGELIRMIFPVGYIFSPNHIHIIVQPPSSPAITGPDEKKILNFIKQLSDIDTSQNVFIVPKLLGIEKDTIIYNRKCYSYLRDFILKDKRYKRYCIIRNPGIGKTYFRWLMLVKLLKQNKSIVIDYKGFTAFINPKNHSVQMITNEYKYRRFAK
ncbi:unnamed protein product [Rhizophagus irregularis]|nr:unnamed protein product [Rhizophagus irregularis]